ncbi:MAG: hypothetical protein AB2A00_37275 [Myxococcota bacterium]
MEKGLRNHREHEKMPGDDVGTRNPFAATRASWSTSTMIKPPGSSFPSVSRNVLQELSTTSAEKPTTPTPATPWPETATAEPAAPRPRASAADQGRARAMARNQGAALQHQLARTIQESEERAIVGGKNNVGKMVDLGGDPRNGLALTIHGINGAPEDVDALSNHALGQGAQTRTFAYDDNYRRLTDTAADLSGQMAGWLRDNPGKPLTVHAHSMGSRVALAALDDLNRQGLLEGRQVDFNMVAPPLGGYSSADGARMAPDFLGNAIKNLRPSKDMGTSSSFQETLEAARLPPNVNVRVFTAGQDTVVDYSNPHFQTIVDNLRAQVIPLPEADHVNAVDAAARWLADR